MKTVMLWRAGAKAHLLSCLALLTILGLQQGPALSVPFFADDYLFLDQVRHVDLGTALHRPDPLGNYYRPLSRQVYFWSLSHLAGESARAAHAINLLLIAAIILMLYFLVARLRDAVSGLVAALPLALHYALDVPARWGAGTQDLFAITFALAAAHCILSDRRWWGASMYLCALWSKEVVLLLPVILIGLTWKRDERLRAAAWRLAPMGISILIWFVVWSLKMARNLSDGAGWSSAGQGALAAFVHLPLVIFGLEFGPHSALVSATLATALASLVVAISILALVARSTQRRRNAKPWTLRLPLWRIGALWTVAGVLPIAWAASLWSAYYYCFALCGVGLIVAGAVKGGLKPWLSALLVCVVAGSTWARHSLAYGLTTSPWTWASHISDAYISRSQRYVLGFDHSLQRALPNVHPNTTFFFGRVPGSIAWQIADGPYVRWAYRDSTLRSYYLSELTDDKLARGNAYLFLADGDTLRNVSKDDALLWGEAFRAVLQGDLPVSHGYLMYAFGHGHANALETYLLAWILQESGDHAAAGAALALVGMSSHPPAGDGVDSTGQAHPTEGPAARGPAERRVAMDPWSAAAHAALADLYIHDRVDGQRAMVEAYAARVLEPGDAWNWRRWAYTQAAWGEAIGALHSIDHYRDLAGPSRVPDPGLIRLEAALRQNAKTVNANGEVELNPSPF